MCYTLAIMLSYVLNEEKEKVHINVCIVLGTDKINW